MYVYVIMKIRNNKHSDVSTTKESLLNVAERLFAEHGYDGVGMRTLAAEADVNLGAATYHFGSKENLYRETVMLCFRPINEERIRLLRQAEKEAQGKPVPVETTIDCMLRPPFMAGLKHPYFPALFTRNLFLPPQFMHEFLAKEGGSVHEPFITALARALPDLPMEVLRLRVWFALGAMLMFLSKKPMRKKTEHLESVLSDMVDFIAAGLHTDSSAIFPSDASPATPSET